MPSIHIIGAMKTASTSLWLALCSTRTGLGVPGGNGWGCACGAAFPAKKEPTLWYNDANVTETTPAQYTQLFRDRRCQGPFIDANVARLKQRNSPLALYKFAAATHHLRQLRLITLLREPISAHLSWYNHRVSARSLHHYLVSDGIRPWCGVRAEVPGGFAVSFTTFVECQLRIQRAWPSCQLVDVLAKRNCSAAAVGGNGACSTLQPSHLTRCYREFDAAFSNSITAWPADPDPFRDPYKRASELLHYMYAPQLLHWQASFNRSSMLLIGFEQFVTSPSAVLRRVLRFTRLPDLMPQTSLTISKANGRSNPCKVQTIECSTLRTLKQFFAPWNEWLFQMLSLDRSGRRAPPEEIPLKPFAFGTPCSSVKLQPIALQRCA